MPGLGLGLGLGLEVGREGGSRHAVVACHAITPLRCAAGGERGLECGMSVGTARPRGELVGLACGVYRQAASDTRLAARDGLARVRVSFHPATAAAAASSVACEQPGCLCRVSTGGQGQDAQLVPPRVGTRSNRCCCLVSLGTRSNRRCCLVSRPLLRQRLRPLLKPCTAATVLIQRLRPLLKPCTAATAGLVASEEGGPAQQRRNGQTGCRRKREGARSALVGHTPTKFGGAAKWRNDVITRNICPTRLATTKHINETRCKNENRCNWQSDTRTNSQSTTTT